MLPKVSAVDLLKSLMSGMKNLDPAHHMYIVKAIETIVCIMAPNLTL